MPELKQYPVFGEHGRIGTLTAAARFLDSRTEKTIHLEEGGELVVPAESLTVQSDGSFLLHNGPQGINQFGQGPLKVAAGASQNEPLRPPSADTIPTTPLGFPNGQAADTRMFRNGYSIERVPVNRIVAESPSQRQEGDTLVLPVVEEVIVVEKRLMLREEIRITPHREQVEQVQTIDSTLQQK